MQGQFDYDDYFEFRDKLFTALASLRESSGERDRIWFSKMWSELLGHLAPDIAFPDDPMAQQAFMLCVEMLEKFRQPNLRVADEVPWLGEDVIENLRLEAAALKPRVASPQSVQLYGGIGNAASLLADNKAFLEWAEESLETKLRGKIKLTYIYYDHPGQRCKVHIDSPEFFTMNCLIGLEQRMPEDSSESSVLRLFTPEEIIDIDLKPGSAAIFHSSGTAHGRSLLKPGETVTLLSVGLNP